LKEDAAMGHERDEVKTPKDYTTPYDLAIRKANWAMKDDPDCAAAFARMRAAKDELDLATRQPRAAQATFLLEACSKLRRGIV
jgi:hypothetical protein